jgi:hypothetical protein
VDPRPRPDGLTTALDLATDLALWGFALWTLLYQAAQLLRLPTTPMVVAWFCGLVVIAALQLRRLRAARAPGGGAPVPGAALHLGGAHLAEQVADERVGDERAGDAAGSAPPLPRTSLLLCAAGIVLALVSAVLTRDSSGAGWVVGWAVGCAAVLAGVVHALLAERGTRTSLEAGPEHSHLAGSLVASATGLALAAFSLFTLRVDPDDAFYVNKSVFVAQHGTIPQGDTLYSHQTLPPLTGAGSAPIQSIEVLQGALAHLFGVAAGSVVYLVVPPVATFLAVWAIWRLVRAWAPRRHLLCFAVSIVFLLLSVM